MAGNDVRPVVKLRSTAGTGFAYVTRKNRRNDPDRLVLKKYDPVLRIPEVKRFVDVVGTVAVAKQQRVQHSQRG